MASDANLLRQRWEKNRKQVNAKENLVRDSTEVERRCKEVEAKSNAAATQAAKREAQEKFKESLKATTEKSRVEMEERLKKRHLQAQQVREEGRRLVKEAAEIHELTTAERAAQRKQAASESKSHRAERVAEDLVGNVVHKAMLAQGSASEGNTDVIWTDQGNEKSQASLTSSVTTFTRSEPEIAVLEAPRERWKKVKPPPVHCPWRLAKTHGIRRRPRKHARDLRTIVEVQDPSADPADVWQDIYRAAIGRAANGEGLITEEGPTSPGSVMPPDVPSTTDLFSASAVSLHDGDPPGYDRPESLRSLAWRQRKDHRYCQLPPVDKSDAEEGGGQLTMRLVPPKIPPSVMRR